MIYIEHSDDQLNVVEHIENAMLRLFWTMLHIYVLQYFQGNVLYMPGAYVTNAKSLLAKSF